MQHSDRSDPNLATKEPKKKKKKGKNPQNIKRSFHLYPKL